MSFFVIRMLNLMLSSIVCASLIISQPALAKSRKALVIGIGDYPNVQKLIGPKQDAQNIKALLIDEFGFKDNQIKLLINQQATREKILGSIQSWLIEGTKAKDEVVFYYSGHGFQIEDKNGDEQDHKDEAIAPYDAVLQDGQIENMVSDDEFKTLFDQIDDRSTTLIIDSCHSGTLTRSLFPNGDESQYVKTISSFKQGAGSVDSPVYSKEIVSAHRKETSFISQTDNRVVWTAVSAWQKALVDFESKSGSVFTNYYIKGIRENLADLNQDKVVSRIELLDYLRAESKQFCERHIKYCKTGMTPTLEAAKDLFVEEASFAVIEQQSNSMNNYQAGSEVDNIAGRISVHSIQNELISSVPERVVVTLSNEVGQYRIGDAITIGVRSPVDGYLVLLDLNTKGELTQLYPNRFSESLGIGNFIKKGVTVQIPTLVQIPIKAKNPKLIYSFNILAYPPVGEGSIIAIVSQDSVFPKTLSLNKDLQVINNPKHYIQAVASSLRKVWTEDELNRPINWLKSIVPYTIVE